MILSLIGLVGCSMSPTAAPRKTGTLGVAERNHHHYDASLAFQRPSDQAYTPCLVRAASCLPCFRGDLMHRNRTPLGGCDEPHAASVPYRKTLPTRARNLSLTPADSDP